MSCSICEIGRLGNSNALRKVGMVRPGLCSCHEASASALLQKDSDVVIFYLWSVGVQTSCVLLEGIIWGLEL